MPVEMRSNRTHKNRVHKKAIKHIISHFFKRETYFRTKMLRFIKHLNR